MNRRFQHVSKDEYNQNNEFNFTFIPNVTKQYLLVRKMRKLIFCWKIRIIGLLYAYRCILFISNTIFKKTTRFLQTSLYDLLFCKRKLAYSIGCRKILALLLFFPQSPSFKYTSEWKPLQLWMRRYCTTWGKNDCIQFWFFNSI